VLGFVIGGGFSLWHALDARWRAAPPPPPSAATAAAAPPPPPLPPLPLSALLREAAAEGGRTCKILVAATAAGGAAGLLLHGRYSDRLFRVQGEPATAFCAAFAAVLASHSGGAGALQRAGGALVVASAAGLVAGLMR
jgi:hypothetical protein